MADQTHDFVIGEGDTGPVLETTLYLPDGTAASINGAIITAKIGNYNKSGTSRAGLPVDNLDTGTAETKGKIRYNWVTADTELLRRGRDRYLEVRFEGTLAGKVLSFKNDGLLIVKVSADPYGVDDP